MHNCIPIKPFRASWLSINGHSCSREQIPIRLSWGMTIHKSQGLTLLKIFVDLGRENSGGGSTFVALSRVKKIDDVFIVPVDWARLQKINGKIMIKLRIKEEKRLRKLESKQ